MGAYGGPEAPKPSKTLRNIEVLERPLNHPLQPHGPPFATPWAPIGATRCPKGAKRTPKELHLGPKFGSFLNIFDSICEAVPQRLPRCPPELQNEPKWSQKSPKVLQMCSPGLQNTSKYNIKLCCLLRGCMGSWSHPIHNIYGKRGILSNPVAKKNHRNHSNLSNPIANKIGEATAI